MPAFTAVRKLTDAKKEGLQQGGACFETRPQFRPGAGSVGRSSASGNPLMALRKLLILRRPPTGPRSARPEDRLRGRLEGRTMLNPGTRRFADSLFRGTRLICLVCTSSKQG